MGAADGERRPDRPRGGLDPSLLEPLVLVHEDYIATSLAALEEEWGGIDGYLGDGLGIDEQLRLALRSVFLDRPHA